MQALNIGKFLYNWQSLSGAFLGAFVPIAVSIFIYWYKSRKEFIRGLGELEHFIVFSVNELYEAREELELFLARLEDLISTIEKAQPGEFFLGSTNFPVSIMEHRLQDISKRTRSRYLANQLMRCYSMLRSTYNFLEDASKEFQSITDRNYQMVLGYKDPSQKVGVSPQDQKGLYLDQLKALQKVIKETILGKNIGATVKALLRARIVLLKYLGNFPTFWKIYYEGIGNLVWKHENAQRIIEKKFEETLKKDFERYEEFYKERTK